MNSNHTPGPWIAEKTSRNDWRVVTGDGATIANVHSPQFFAEREHSAESNSAIVAAAPDLLKAAKFLVQAARTNGLDKVPFGLTAQAVAEAVAAIAKAEAA